MRKASFFPIMTDPLIRIALLLLNASGPKIIPIQKVITFLASVELVSLKLSSAITFNR